MTNPQATQPPPPPPSPRRPEYQFTESMPWWTIVLLVVMALGVAFAYAW